MKKGILTKKIAKGDATYFLTITYTEIFSLPRLTFTMQLPIFVDHNKAEDAIEIQKSLEIDISLGLDRDRADVFCTRHKGWRRTGGFDI